MYIPHCSDWLSLIENNSLLVKALQEEEKQSPANKRRWEAEFRVLIAEAHCFHRLNKLCMARGHWEMVEIIDERKLCRIFSGKIDNSLPAAFLIVIATALNATTQGLLSNTHTCNNPSHCSIG